MQIFKRPVCILLSLIMILSIFTCIPFTVTAETNTLTDKLTLGDTPASSTAYVNWTAGKDSGHPEIVSDAVYSGNSAKGNGGIQMRSKNYNSGIVTTASGGYLRKLTVEWKDIYNNNDRELKVFGSNTSYSAPSELYDTSAQGTLLGTLGFNESDYDFTNEVCVSELTVDGNYRYIGIRSSTGALYLESVSFEWDTDAFKPVWSWADDYSSATATFSDGTNDTVIDATVSSEVTKEASYLQKGVRVYTASVIYNDVYYTDRQTEDIPELTFDGSVSYIDENGELQTASGTALLTPELDTLSSGWYAVCEDVTFDQDITVSDDVKLILCDGVTVACRICGFELSGENDKLTIYGQENNSGRIRADLDPAYNINVCHVVYGDTDVNDHVNTGSLILNGGTVERGSASSCCIAAKSITVNGGIIKNCVIDDSDSVTINGGNISLESYTTALKADHLAMNGGRVTVSGDNAEAINANEFVFNGGKLEVDGGICAASKAELSWSDSSDSIYAKRYNHEVTEPYYSHYVSRSVTLKKDFVDESGKVYTAGIWNTDDTNQLGGVDLYPFTNPWEELQTLIADASDGAVIKLNKSYKASASDNALLIPEGKTLTLDLNGFTIDRGLAGKSAVAGGNVITNKGSLTIKDTSRAKSGKITGGNNTGNGGGIISDNYWEVIIENGSVTGNRSDGNGGGIWGNGWVVVEDGSVTGNTADGNGGGICFDANNSNNKLKVSGAPVISGNKKSDGSENNVYLTSQISIYPYNNAALDSEAVIGISVPNTTEQRTITDYTFRNKCSQDNFRADSERYIFSLNPNNDVRIQQSYVFSFDANGGSGSMENIVVIDPVITLPECTFTAPDGKRFKAWSDGVTSTEYPVDEELEISSAYHEFTITPIWEQLYSITANAKHGSVTANRSEAAQGEKVSLNLIPDEDYTVKSVTVNGTAVEPVNGVYSFRMPESNVLVVASFIATKQTYYSDIAVFCAVGTANDGWDENAALAESNDYTIAVEDLNRYTDQSPVISLGYKTTTKKSDAIKDVVLRVSSSNDSPESLTYAGRTYYRCDCYTESYTHFTDIHGDLDCGTGGKYVHLYYTKETSPDSHDAITEITADTNSSGAVTNTSGDAQSVETANSAIEDYYLHTTGEYPIVSYIDTAGAAKDANAETVTASTGTLLGGWYAVTEEIVNNNRLTCSGNVNLILCDGATFTAHKGITVTSGNSLTIWQQENRTGALTIDNCASGSAGIGGVSGQIAGTITINGGVINTRGGTQAAGIGGGAASSASVITINGGTVNAEGGSYGVGIGSGTGNSDASGGTVTINGGSVRAVGESIGIGSDDQNDDFTSCTVTLNWNDYSRKNMSVYVDSTYGEAYNASVTFSKSFYDKASMTEYGAGYFGYTDSLKGRTLIPNVNGWAVLQQQINSAQNGDTITLGGYNYSATSGDTALTVSAGKNITIDLNGYTINRNLNAAAENGCAIINNGTLTLTGGGRIIGANNTSEGGAILNNGTLTIENAELSGNTAAKGGGVYNSSGASFTVNGGSIKNNISNNYSGGGIYNSGTVTINDGTISENSTESGGNGGGIFNTGTLNVFGGTIKNNTCRSNGGGIFFSAGSINVSGSPVISDNKNTDNTDNNLDLSSKKITVTGTLSESAKIGIKGATPGKVVTQGLNGIGSVQNFFCDYSGYLLRADSNGEAIVVNARTIAVNSSGKGTTSVDADNNKAAEGDTVTVTAVPQEGCYVESITYRQTGGAINPAGGTLFTGSVEDLNHTISKEFTMPDGNVEVTVTYKQQPLTYLDIDGSSKTLTDYTVVTGDLRTMSTGWYAVTYDVAINRRVTVEGNVNLLLCDGADYQSDGGLKVQSGNSLTIWQQENGTGKLTAVVSSRYDHNFAVIGSNKGYQHGNITINGGMIDVTAPVQNPAIGCGETTNTDQSAGSGIITINGGNITAKGGALAAGIGGGWGQSGGTITINGGVIDATAGNDAGAIGSGYCGMNNDTTVTINGGNITAHGAIGFRNADVKLTWSNLSDSIYADSYSGTVTMNKNFTDGTNSYSAGAVSDNSVLAGKTLRPERFTGHSLSLGGDIGVNFYVDLTDEEAQTATVDFSWTVNGVEKTHSVNIKDVEHNSCGYKASCPIAVAEMTYNVTATLTIGSVTYTDTYSAVTYADVILNNSDFADRYVNSENEKGKNGQERLEQLQTLVKTMLDYGTKAQVRFDRNTDNLANGGTDYFSEEVTLTLNADDMNEYLSACGLEYVGTSVVYLSKTTLRHYYRIVQPDLFTEEIQRGVTFDGAAVIYGTRNGMIYFDKPDISASNLDTAYVISINGHDYSYSALDYSALSYNGDEKPYSESIAKQLAAAVYRYNTAANAYFND